MAAIALLAVFVTATEAAPPAALPGYGADPHQTSVSGLSSGAFMAVQLQVAYSRSIIGAGVVAGGPYYCAANNMAYTGICMGQMPLRPNPYLMANAAKRFADSRLIDPIGNLAKRRVYVFSGTDDSIVRQPAVDATVTFFKQVGVRPVNLEYVNKMPAGHAVITPSNGNNCSANSAPYISHCSIDGTGYDQAGAVLRHIYGALKPRVGAPAGQIVSFDQRRYAAKETGMADAGFLYVPQACAVGGVRCKVHVALHGCAQSAESVGDKFYKETGYNNWADSNQILVLYPQVDKSTSSPSNPYGCWDWWGYTGDNYAHKSSVQMVAIKAMVNRLVQHR
ncbi:MAG TPA: PHB depolymerase family esterase [Ramlibacter sp.]|nr:PHB depolymerase family esterase [Ramlibacter sp.]